MSDEAHFVEKVIGPHELFNETSVGWVVIERFDHDEPIQVQEPVPPDLRQQYYGQPTYMRQQMGRVSSFRVKRAVDSPIAALTEQVGALRFQHQTDEQKLKDAERSLETEKTSHLSTKSLLKRVQDDIEQMRTQRAQIEEIKRQLERDLGKVREHIGRKLFDEILPPPPPKSVTQ